MGLACSSKHIKRTAPRSLKIVDDAFDAVWFESFLDKLQVQRMDLVFILRFLIRKDQVQSDLIALLHHRAMTGRHFADVKAEHPGNGLQIHPGSCEQGL